MLLGRIQLGVTAEHPSPSLPADLQVPGRGEIAPAVADAPPGAAGRVSSRTGATPTTPAAPVTVGLPRSCPPLGGRSTPRRTSGWACTVTIHRSGTAVCGTRSMLG